ncbi:ABC transporter permease [Companilactobacillus kimchii]|uniref:ABC-type dipeptide oligopeptide nickel transport system, permease component n=2 Tax=Companilactobacillus kimchii TaxID=2801452 RepID=A0ABR5NRT8_9LACO|nr:ABC transporter permease [Companilactobacillus kimchii]KAE9557719.1 peptide ABC transporter permease [Companilactobacillus kimchii]KRK50846.1 ABC-type dipeptide oligopeptide nickel transport system, permease component [Companilactobacillus kimchii DSM 13961 = JCM 10707]OWF33539.1 Oligopeptide transport system permease protein OppC [Companilactobacillus kimchii]GEO48298.1 peptide ABC transporter permease [Companilactobacillus paralimentarius]
MEENLNKHSNISAADLKRLTKEADDEATPSSAKIIWNEFRADKPAMVALFIVIAFILFVMIASLFINTSQIMQTNIMNYNASPGTSGFVLGADSGGRPIAQQLIVGARNSIGIAIGLTIISSTFGICWGLISGYFNGYIDWGMQRVYDFMMMLPMTMMIIVLVTIIKNYNAVTLTLIFSIFYWEGTSRLIRSRTLSESEKDYVAASKTSGTNSFKIIFREIMPNISSLIIVDTTLSFAENIGVETGLSYLGFGLPIQTPSLGTLIANANDPNNITQYWWTWLPAALLIIVLCLSISYIGQVIRRSADASQRQGTEN